MYSESTVKKLARKLHSDNPVLVTATIYDLKTFAIANIDISYAVPDLINLFKNSGERIKTKIADTLEVAAKIGCNVSTAIPVMMSELENRENQTLRKCATNILKYSIRRKASRGVLIRELTKALKDDSGFIRGFAADSLKDAIEKGADISPAINALANSIHTEKYTLSAIIALKEAAKKGSNITSAIGTLVSVLKSRSGDAEHSVQALAYAVLNEKSRDVALRALKNTLSDINLASGAMHSLEKAAAWEVDEALDTIILSLKHDNPHTRAFALDSLSNLSRKRDISHALPAMIERLGDKSETVRESALKALDSPVKNWIIKKKDRELLLLIKRKMKEAVKNEKDPENRLRIKIQLVNLSRFIISNFGAQLELGKLKTAEIPKGIRGKWRTGMKKRALR